VTLPSFAQEADVQVLPPPTQRIQIRPGFSAEILLKHAYSRVEIANPSVVDVQPQTDRDVTLVAAQAGSTIIKFRDEKGAVVGQLVAVVWPPTSKKSLATFEDIPGRVKVYRGADRTGFYRCFEGGCELVAEQQISERSPGHTSISVPATITDEMTETDKSQESGSPKP
jgi:Flp pilus assembly secretin CpaC